MAGGWRRETVIAAAAALVVASFGAGFGVAKIAQPHSAPAGHAPAEGFQWPFFGKPRDPKAPRALPKKPDGFGVWTTRLDTSRADPQACIRMSRDLDPRRSYGDFVSVAPDLGHPAAVNVNGDELCVAGVGYELRKITLLHGLPAQSGEVLADDAEVAFEQGEKQPYVGFAGTGVILPREDADGIGLETVNVSKLAIELWRVPDRNLVRKEIGAPEPTPEGGYDYDGGENGVGDDGRKVWEGTLAVHGKADERTTTVFPFGAVLKTLEPGAYVIRAKDASGLKGETGKKGEGEGTTPANARRWMLFTDMALQAYHGTDALDVTVRSLKTAKAMGGVRVALVGKDGKDLGSANSDADGRAHFDHALLAGEAGAAPAQIMAYGPKADFVAMDLSRAPVDLSKQDIGGRTPPGAGAKTGKDALAAAGIDGFVYADRGVYRPGETVHVTALLRDSLARAVKDRPGAIVIRRPSGLEFQRLRFVATPNGAVANDIVLPRSSPRGHWRATLEMDGSDGSSGEATFQVEDFAPQRLAVTLGADPNRPVLAGEQRPVAVDAKFLYGAVAAGLPVQAEARITSDPDPFPAFAGYEWGDQQTPFAEKLAPSAASTTDGAGHATETLDASQVQGATQPLMATFTASVFEPGGRPVAETAKLKLRMKPLYLGVKTTSTGAGDKPVQTFEIIAVDGHGRRAAVQGATYLLVAEKWDYEWFEQGGRWSWKRTSRDIPIAKGQLSLTADRAAKVSRALPWGDYRLILEDPASGAKTVIRQSSGWGEPVDGVEAPDTARVSPVKAGYRTGDTVQVHIQAPFAGEAQVAVATDRMLAMKSVSVPAGGATISLKADASWAGGAYVLVSVVQPRDPVASPKPRRALGVAYVPLETPGRKLTVAVNAPAKYDSKSEITVPLQVKGLKLGQRAHVTLAAVDEGILRLTHQANPDPVSWYFGKRAMSLDYRDDYGRLLDPNLGAAGSVNFGADEMGGAGGLSATPIKTVALWSGVVDTGLDGKTTIKLPAAAEFNGQLRLVAVAWTDEAVGSGVSDVIVREPVVAELSLPRFLAPGDHAFATVELHNVEGKVGQYLAELFGRGGIFAPLHKLYDLALSQRVVERTEIVGAPNPGVGRVDFKVSGPGFVTTKSYPLETRLGWGPITRATVALQKPGDRFTPMPDLLAGLSPGGGLSMTVSYSPFRGFDPAPIADSLSRYPYGCSEQLVSAAYPLLYAPEVGTDPKLKRVSPQIAGAISKLLDREALDGSFGLWRVGDGEADPWLGAYITDFLLEAKARGAAVPDDALARALDAMRLISRPEGFGSVGYRMTIEPSGKNDVKGAQARTERLRSRAAAYALYVMAKAKRGDLPRLRWFHDVGFATEPSPLARAQVGAALAAMGDGGRAHDSFVKAVAALNFKEPDDLYQSPLRDLAGVIAYAYEAGEVGIARSLQSRLEQTVKSPDDLNTQEQAHLLRAAHAMLAQAGPIRINAVGAGSLGGSRWAVGKLADAHFVNGGGEIWRTVTVHGLPNASPPASNTGLSVEKSFFAMNGARIDPGALKQGDRVVIRLAGGLREARSRQVVIDDALPAGFEIESTLTPEDAAGTKDDNGKATAGAFAFLGQLSTASVQEKRDDRYIASLTTGGGKGYVLAYTVRAVTPGDFYLPGAEARDMYRPTVRGRTAAGRARIARGS